MSVNHGHGCDPFVLSSSTDTEREREREKERSQRKLPKAESDLPFYFLYVLPIGSSFLLTVEPQKNKKIRKESAIAFRLHLQRFNEPLRYRVWPEELRARHALPEIKKNKRPNSTTRPIFRI